MINMKSILSISDFKTNLSSFVKQLKEEHNTLVVTQNGQPALVVMSPEEYELLQVRMQALALHTAYDNATANFKQGRHTTFDSGMRNLYDRGIIRQ